jgi:hypothetical protein
MLLTHRFRCQAFAQWWRKRDLVSGCRVTLEYAEASRMAIVAYPSAPVDAAMHRQCGSVSLAIGTAHRSLSLLHIVG